MTQKPLLALLAYVAAGSRQRNEWREAGGRDGPRRALMERAMAEELWGYPGRAVQVEPGLTPGCRAWS